MRYTKSAVLEALREVQGKYETALEALQQDIDKPQSERLLEELRRAKDRLAEVEQNIAKDPERIREYSTIYSLSRRVEDYETAVDEYKRAVIYGREDRTTLQAKSEHERQVKAIDGIKRVIVILESSADDEVNTTELERLDVYKHLRKYL